MGCYVISFIAEYAVRRKAWLEGAGWQGGDLSGHLPPWLLPGCCDMSTFLQPALPPRCFWVCEPAERD